MTIQRVIPQPRVRLPRAALYIDDLEEIIGSLRPEGHDQPPVLEFIVDDQRCDTIDDLRKIGGRTNSFEMNVKWNMPVIPDHLYLNSISRARIEVGGPVKHRVWAMEQVRAVFYRRRGWLGKYRMAATLVFALLFLVVFYFWILIMDRYQVKAPIRYMIDVVIAVPWGVGIGTFHTKSVRSVVVLQNYADHPGSWFRRNREKIEVAAVTSLITAVITTIVAVLIHRLSK
jgi:hypothetical protein